MGVFWFPCTGCLVCRHASCAALATTHTTHEERTAKHDARTLPQCHRVTGFPAYEPSGTRHDSNVLALRRTACSLASNMAAVAGTSLASALPDDAAREAANQERHMVSDFDAVPVRGAAPSPARPPCRHATPSRRLSRQITFMLPHGEEWTVQVRPCGLPPAASPAPLGRPSSAQFQSGQDIAFMKYTLHKEWGIPISVMVRRLAVKIRACKTCPHTRPITCTLPVQTLVVGGDSLIDPMSIADYPELMDGSSQVTVAIPTGERYAEYEARLAAESSEGKAGDGKAPEGDGKVSGEGKE